MDELMYTRKVSTSCPTSDTRHVTIAANPMIRLYNKRNIPVGICNTDIL